MENGFRVFDLAEHDEAIRTAQFISKYDLGETMYCRIPEKYYNDLVFISVCEPGKPNVSDESITIIPDNPWIDIAASAMNQNPGYHMYQFTFFNKAIQQRMFLYIYYFMQLNDPEKPYIYMNREEEAQ